MRGQASLQGLYNPDRVASPLKKEGNAFNPVSWEDALALFTGKIRTEGSAKGVWLLTSTLTASMDALCGEWLKAVGSSHHVVHEPFAHDALREGNRISFGVAEIPRYDLAKANYVISFGADFLDTWLSPVELTRGFANAHGYADGKMARFVSVEPSLSMSASSADEWIAPVPGTEMLVALSTSASLSVTAAVETPLVV